MSRTIRTSVVLAGALGAGGAVCLAMLDGGGAIAQPAPATDVPAEPAPVEPAPAEPAAAAATAPTPAPGLDADAIARLVDARLAAQPFVAGWKDGFYVRSSDGQESLKLGLFTQFDARFFTATSPAQVDQFAFRSVRPELQATTFGHFDVRLLPDFAGGKLVLQDAYADVHYGDLLRVRVGKQKVPFGLERLQYETATTFVERGLPTQLAPNRDLGVQLYGELGGGVLAYQAGVWNGVADGQSGDGDVSDGKEGSLRVLVQPFAGGGSIAKHLGVGGAATWGQKNGTLAAPDLPVFKTQGQTTWFAYRSGTTLADTAVADGHQWRATAQADWYAGPVGVLAEYVRSVQRVAIGPTASHVTAEAWQVLAQWVVTGDDATYKSVTPRHPFDPAHGRWGAVDVAARVGQLALDDNAFVDGVADRTKAAHEATQIGGGVDWFVNASLRLVVDVDRTTFRGGGAAGADRAPETSIIGRVQTVF